MIDSKTSTKDKIIVMAAYLTGANIQRRDRRINGSWFNVSQPTWDWDCYEYRIDSVQELSVNDINKILSVETKMNIGITKVIYDDPATVVFWSDGSKTVVKATNETFDPEKGLAMAITKKVLGNKGKYFNEFKRWLPEDSTSANGTI